MRKSNAQFELFHAASVLAANRSIGNVAGFGIARRAEIGRRAREYKNSGNEAKKYLKIKGNGFLNDANCTP